MVSAAGVQGIVTRPESRDHLTLRLALAGNDINRDTLVEPLKQSVRSVCRVRLDEVEFVAADAISADAPGMVDERDWG